jgi:hypothetical protein
MTFFQTLLRPANRRDVCEIQAKLACLWLLVITWLLVSTETDDFLENIDRHKADVKIRSVSDTGYGAGRR